MNRRPLSLLAAALGLSLFANPVEAQFDLTPPLLGTTSHRLSPPGAQLHLQQNGAQAQRELRATALSTPQLELPPRRYHLWSILWGTGSAVVLGGAVVGFVEWFDDALGCFDEEDCSRSNFGAAAALLSVGGLMLVGGLVGHIRGAAKYRRRMRHYEQGAVYLEGTTLHW